MQRCEWVGDTQQYQDYHDNEWGVPIHDDRTLFEFLILEGAQAGLSWTTILQKRAGYLAAYGNFDPVKVADYDQTKIDQLIQNPEIVRNKLKIHASVNNARIFLDIQKECGSFNAYLWEFVQNTQIQNNFTSVKDVPASVDISDTLSKDLKKRGMKFVGTTIMYAFMQAVGMVNDHTTDCWRHQPIKQEVANA